MRIRKGKAIVIAALSVISVSALAFSQQTSSKEKLVVEKISIQPKAVYVVERGIPAGRTVVENPGKPGLITRTYRVTYQGSRELSKVLVSKDYIAPEEKVIKIGKTISESSRGSFVRGRVIELMATAYLSHSSGRHSTRDSYTRSGRKAAFGCVAVDPRVIPLGTWIYVEGYGIALACDTGGAIKGHRIDLCMESNSEVSEFGRKKVKVYILTKR